MTTMDVNINSVAKDITMNIRFVGMSRFRFRLKVAILFIRLAQFFSGLAMKVEVE